MSQPFPDPSLYVHPPVMTVAGGITLCRVVVDASPATMPAYVKKAVKRVLEVAETAQVAHTARIKALAKDGEEDTRVVDKSGDNSWGALRGRLQNYALLPEMTYPDAKRANEIIVSLFGESGLSFLTEKYPEQHAIAESILRRIDGESMAVDIDRIAGKDFLENVRAQHIAYGTMVAAMLKREKALAEDMSDHLRDMGQALVEYATKVLASMDRDTPATIKAAQTALRPIDVFREAAQAHASSGGQATKAPEVSPNAAEG